MFQPASSYPLHRPRRLRGHPRLREMISETRLDVDDLIYPLFVYHGKGLRREITSMPGQYQLSLDRLGESVAEAAELGIPAILLFGIPEHKDDRGSAALLDDGIVQRAIQVAKEAAPGILVITDLCFCEYTDHGHCGPLAEAGGRMDVDNDATLPLLAQQAISHTSPCRRSTAAPSSPSTRSPRFGADQGRSRPGLPTRPGTLVAWIRRSGATQPTRVPHRPRQRPIPSITRDMDDRGPRSIADVPRFVTYDPGQGPLLGPWPCGLASDDLVDSACWISSPTRP